MIFKKILKGILPRFILDILYKFKYQITSYVGPYQNWEIAQQNSKGWNDERILDKIVLNTDFCLNNPGYYERDGEVLSDENYPKKIVEFLNETIIDNDVVLDYGGSLGSLYYQIRSKINLKILNWVILEQKIFFEASKKIKKNKEISFIEDLENIQNLKPAVIIFSSVLQYLNDPKLIIDKINLNNYLANKKKYIIIDRIILSNDSKDLIYVQKNPKKHLNTSYPIRLFSKEFFLKNYFPNFELKYIDKSYLGKDFILNGNKLGYYTIILSNK